MLSGRPQEGTSKVAFNSKLDSRRPKFSDSNIYKARKLGFSGSECHSLTLYPNSYTACKVLIWPLRSLQTDPCPRSTSSLQPHWPPPCSQNKQSLFLPQGHRTHCSPSARMAPLVLLTLPTATASHPSGLGSNATSSKGLLGLPLSSSIPVA